MRRQQAYQNSGNSFHILQILQPFTLALSEATNSKHAFKQISLHLYLIWPFELRSRILMLALNFAFLIVAFVLEPQIFCFPASFIVRTCLSWLILFMRSMK